MTSPGQVAVAYAVALEAYLADADEAGLERAYELGREAISQGLGVIELASIHGKALSPRADLHRAGQFFAEALAPFEMALRGFREANQALKRAAETLERRVDERTSELRSAENSVREQTRLLNSVVESMSDGLAVADRAGKLLLLNGAGQRLLGPAARRAPPSEWGAQCGIFQPDALTPFPAGTGPLVRALQGELTESEPMFVQNPSVPEGVHVSVTGSLLRDERGQHSGGIALLRDVTESKRAQEALRKTEEQLRQSQKMDAIGRLAGGIAHDFNNILSVIISLSDLAHGELSAGSPLAGDLEEIHKAGVRAAALTRQLLMFSRQQLFEPRAIDLSELLAGMDKMLQRLIGADVELVTVRNGPLGKIRADRGNLEQVVMNLVVNARDAMPTGGRLTLETSEVVVDKAFASQHVGMSVGRYVMLAVTDTGIGMDKATQARIFEPFFTTKEQGKGTGLGLSTVFGIVRQSGGAVWVYSEPGKGTTFKVYFPRVDGVPVALAPAEPATDLRGDETILLVEDDAQVRSVANGILSRLGYRVLEARTAGEALQLAQSHPGDIHLLLTDVVMPQLSGMELARRLSQTRPQLKIICMSGYTDDSVVRHGVLDAHVAYLQKPITPESLGTKVRSVLGNRR